MKGFIAFVSGGLTLAAIVFAMVFFIGLGVLGAVELLGLIYD